MEILNFTCMEEDGLINNEWCGILYQLYKSGEQRKGRQFPTPASFFSIPIASTLLSNSDRKGSPKTNCCTIVAITTVLS